MRKVLSIEGKEKHFDTKGHAYYLTYATVDDGTECLYWSNDTTTPIAIGDLVEVFLHRGKIKCRLPVDKH